MCADLIVERPRQTTISAHAAFNALDAGMRDRRRRESTGHARGMLTQPTQRIHEFDEPYVAHLILRKGRMSFGHRCSKSNSPPKKSDAKTETLALPSARFAAALMPLLMATYLFVPKSAQTAIMTSIGFDGQSFGYLVFVAGSAASIFAISSSATVSKNSSLQHFGAVLIGAVTIVLVSLALSLLFALIVPSAPIEAILAAAGIAGCAAGLTAVFVLLRKI
jgi:hypothetical protein